MKTCIINLRFAKKAVAAFVAMVLVLGFSTETLRAQGCTYKSYTPDYCTDMSPSVYGVYYCASTDTDLPEGDMMCSPPCITASNCIYFNMRFLPGPRCTGEITKIEITITKEAGSNKFQVCNPYTQWGWGSFTSEWDVTDQYLGGITTSACNDWGIYTSRTLTFDPPAPSYELQDPYHWMVTICGADSLSVKLYYSNNERWTFSPTVTSDPCPVACP